MIAGVRLVYEYSMYLEFFFQSLKGLSHEINVWFFGAQWIEKILLLLPRKGFSSYYKRFHV